MFDADVMDSLRFNLGPLVLEALEDPDVIEILLNDDGMLWLDSFGKGMTCRGQMDVDRAAGIIRLVASMLDTVVDKDSPVVEGELPLDGSRFEGLFPPVVARPSFTIRKKASRVFSLDQYVHDEVMPESVRQLLIEAIKLRRNILVVGGTGSGKTTLTNAILAALAEENPDDRVIIIEDTNELQCVIRNKVMLHTTQTTSMRDLLKATMRLRPDRIIVGEVRGGEALDLLKAWNTGHPGGVCTVHANDAYGGLVRLEQLIAEVSQSPMPTLIKEAVHLIVFIKRTRQGRKVTEVAAVAGLDYAGSYALNTVYNSGDDDGF
jgi:type IV secretion system protein TrbB